jgi:FlaA1/EpsC-like NDP-sugar epimerase
VADENGCKSFVLISSDKAVNPTSTMGATKRLGELIVSRRPGNGMRSVAVRFGNVLGSSGSVIPVLQEQLRNGKPLTVTHPEMKRFFMTTREAVSLVLQAFTVGEHGDTLVLDMGEPIKILDLARTLIQLSGSKSDEVEIAFTGLRPGEKLIEELFYSEETICETSCPKIKKARHAPREWSELETQLDELRGTLYVDGANPIRARIKQIIPEYSYCLEIHNPQEDFQPRKAAIGA